jgi:hypothetical protein
VARAAFSACRRFSRSESYERRLNDYTSSHTIEL